ncbi:MAG TPA: hypothetical protein VN253_07395 [Kofleriaceae bacterium]|nr:hypothetical protein [Kofleriaceae bacterium]
MPHVVPALPARIIAAGVSQHTGPLAWGVMVAIRWAPPAAGIPAVTYRARLPPRDRRRRRGLANCGRFAEPAEVQRLGVLHIDRELHSPDLQRARNFDRDIKFESRPVPIERRCVVVCSKPSLSTHRAPRGTSTSDSDHSHISVQRGCKQCCQHGAMLKVAVAAIWPGAPERSMW